MRIEYKLPKRVRADSATSAIEPGDGPPRPSRLARLIALAHKLEARVQCGEVLDYRELARLAQISDSRLSQILILAQLAPEIQERLLFADESLNITEPDVRKIARHLKWDRQSQLFNSLRGR